MLNMFVLKDAGEKALRGPNGWFFYKPGVEYLTQRQARSNDCGRSRGGHL